MDLFNQILCRFQKCKQKVPPPSPLFGQKKKTSLNDMFFFDQRGGTVEELFAYIFGIYIKFGYKDPSILAPFDSVSVAT